MSKQLELKVVLSAIDKMTAPLRGISQQAKRLSVGFKADMAQYNNVLKLSKGALKDVQAEQKRLAKIGKPISQELIQSEKALLQQINSTNAAIDARHAKMDAEMDIVKRRTAAYQRGQSMMTSGAMNIAKAGAMGYAGYKFMQEGIGFDEVMSKVQALTRLDKDSEELQLLREQSKYLGATTWADPTQVAEGQAFYAMAGFTPENIMKAMPSTLDLARASGIEIGRAADIGSNIMSAFKLPADQMKRVSDSLVATFTRTNVDMEMLSQSMKYVAPVAQSLGMGLEESLAMIGLLGNVGIQGDQAGTALRAIEQRLANPPKMAADALKTLGIRTKDNKGNLRNVAEIFKEIFEKTQHMGTADRTKYLSSISGLEASAAMMELTSKDSYKMYANLLEDVLQAYDNDEAAVTAKVMSDNVAGDIEELSSSWSDFKIAIYEVNKNGLRTTLQFITEIMTKIGDFAKANPKIVEVLSKAATYGMIFFGVLGSLSLAMGAFNLIVLANPIVAIITAVIGAIALLITYKDEIWDFFGNFSKAPGEHIKSAMGYITDLGNTISNFLNDIPVIGPVLRGIFEISLIPLKYLKFMWTSVIKGFQWIGDNWGAIVGWFDMMWSGIIVGIQPITQSIQGIWDTIKTGISITKEWFTKLWDSVSDDMKPVIDIFNLIIEAISEMINGIREFFSFETPGWVSAIGDGLSNSWDYLVGNDVIEHNVTPAMVGGASIVAANPVSNSQTNNNNVNINISTETNASPGVIAGAVVSQLHSSGLIGDLQ